MESSIISATFPRNIRGLEEKRKLCDAWKQSGKSKRYFCQEKNIPLSTFFSWCNRFYPEETKKRDPHLIPVKVINKKVVLTKTPVATQTTIEIMLPTQTTLRFSLGCKDIVAFIQELCHATATIR